MKKIAAVCLLTIAFSSSTYAQKYMTRTGKVTFYSATPLEKIEAVNNESASILDSKTGDVIFQLPVKSFKFDRELMQEHFNENYMESDKFPKSEFKGKIKNISEVNFAKDAVYNVTTAGKLTMHGVTKDINVSGTVTVKGGSVKLNSKFNIKPGDYGIKIPSLVAEKIAKEIEITVSSDLNAIK